MQCNDCKYRDTGQLSQNIPIGNKTVFQAVVVDIILHLIIEISYFYQ